MAAEERELVWKLPSLVDWNNGESTTSTGFPIDRDVLWVGLRLYERQSVSCASDRLTLIRLVSQAFLVILRLS